MKDYHINVFYNEDDEGYIADIPDLQHCSAFGATPEEALRRSYRPKRPGWRQHARAADPSPGRGIVLSFIKRCERCSGPGAVVAGQPLRPPVVKRHTSLGADFELFPQFPPWCGQALATASDFIAI